MAALSANKFYANYHGHELEHLAHITPALRQQFPNVVWLAGDSSLDSKHWLFGGAVKEECDLASAPFAAPAIQGYESVLDPPRMVKDVAYAVSAELQSRGVPMCCINAAVEESTISDRARGLVPHDEFVRANLQDGDVVVVSVGGNDVALRPAPETQQHLRALLTSPEADWPAHPSLEYFVGLFKDRVQEYIEGMTAHATCTVIVCMIYFPDEKPGGSWADPVLGMLGYNQMPQILQALMRLVYREATQKIAGKAVVPLPLFEVLDSTNTEDYVQRVEPSAQGAEKMAKAFADVIEQLGASD